MSAVKVKRTPISHAGSMTPTASFMNTKLAPHMMVATTMSSL